MKVGFCLMQVQQLQVQQLLRGGFEGLGMGGVFGDFWWFMLVDGIRDGYAVATTSGGS
jgi:hypothetical protein